jgi:hypothetical protein
LGVDAHVPRFPAEPVAAQQLDDRVKLLAVLLLVRSAAA